MSHAFKLRVAAMSDTPRPSMYWKNMLTDDQRKKACQDGFTQIIVKDARADGQIIVELANPLSAADRGTLLLDYERALKETVDRGLTVWLAPAQDKNVLRHLRGVVVK